MSKKPSESESLSAKQADKQEKGSKDGETRQQQKKQTVQFDDGQKFTSDDDLLKRRSA